MHPHACVAVGLELAAHARPLFTGLARVVRTENTLNVLDMVSPLVGDNVFLCEHRIGGTVLGDHVVKEPEVEVHRRVSGAVERAHRARRGATGSGDGVCKDLEIGQLVRDARVLSGQLRLPHRVQRLRGGDHAALNASIRIVSRLAGGRIDRRRGGGRGIRRRRQQARQIDAGEVGEPEDQEDTEQRASARPGNLSPRAGRTNTRRIQTDVVIETHGCSTLSAAAPSLVAAKHVGTELVETPVLNRCPNSIDQTQCKPLVVNGRECR